MRRRVTLRPHRGRLLRPRALRARRSHPCTRCRHSPAACALLRRRVGAATADEAHPGGRQRPCRRLVGGTSAARTTASAARTRRARPCVAWTVSWGSAEAAAAAVGGARGGCEACTHTPVRFFARSAHLARVAAAGGGEVAEGGDVGGGDRGDEWHRTGAVGPSRGVLGGTCARIQAHKRASEEGRWEE
jgi:hypothetical protein